MEGTNHEIHASPVKYSPKKGVCPFLVQDMPDIEAAEIMVTLHEGRSNKLVPDKTASFKHNVMVPLKAGDSTTAPPRKVLYDRQVLQDWGHLEHVHVGFTNTRNSSFMNATLQALLHIPAVIDWLDNDFEHRAQCQYNNCVTCAIGNLRLDMKNTSCVDPSSVYFLLEEFVPQFERNNEHDAQDFLHQLMERLKQEFLGRFCTDILGEYCRHSTPIGRIFGGLLETVDECPHCYLVISSTLSPFHMITINSDSSSVQRGVDDVLSDSTLNTACRNCKCHVVANRKCTVVEPPAVIAIHIDRFDHIGCKTDNPINLNQFIKIGSDVHYSFLSGVLHERGTKDNGYHSALVKCPTQNFVFISDTRIKGAPPHFVGMNFDFNAYLLFYGKQEGHTKRTTNLNQQQMKSTATTSRCNLKFSGKPQRLKSILPPRKKADAEMIPIIQELPAEESSQSVALENGSNMVSVGVQTPFLRPLVSYHECKTMSALKFRFFTGINQMQFQLLYDFLGGDEVVRNLKFKYSLSTPKKRIALRALSGEDRLFITLLRLRRGLPLEDLGYACGLSDSQTGDIVYTMLRHLYLTFKTLEDALFVTAKDQRKNKPKPFRPFRNLRVILDGAEFRIEHPSNFEQQGNTYSSYKASNTIIFAIGISCYGGIIFVSPAYEGSMSDKEVVLNSGLLKRLEPGDSVMTDRGYLIESELQEIGVHLLRPPLLGSRSKLTPREEIVTKAIASSRIYVEHAIRRIKEFRILRGTIPLTLLPILEDMVYVCAMLTNFGKSHVK